MQTEMYLKIRIKKVTVISSQLNSSFMGLNIFNKIFVNLNSWKLQNSTGKVEIRIFPALHIT